VNSIKNVVIVGGGSAGWMAAAMLARVVGRSINICLIESDDIPTIGVGEATIPPIQIFNQALGIRESDFLKATQGTFKLGIQFENWGQEGQHYMHAFGDIGKDLGLTPFHHYVVRATRNSPDIDYWDFSLNYQAALKHRFSPLTNIPDSPLCGIRHAYHFDAGLYAQLLRKISVQSGVERKEGKVVDVALDSRSGHITSVRLADGQVVEGDLFIDCSGFRGRLIEQALQTGYEDWSHWLPCDRAVAVQSESESVLRPYTRSIAHAEGWQWQIPLQHRIGNGFVYAGRYLDEASAVEKLCNNIDGRLLNEPRTIKFVTGRRKKQWNRNCIALGLASGFLEPLESTSLHLVQSAITRLLKLFPRADIEPSVVDEYNRQSLIEFEGLRDFIILHYHLNSRKEGVLWSHCRTMDVPDRITQKIDLFRRTGRIHCASDELFSNIAWQQVLIGQGGMPNDYDPMADHISDTQLSDYLNSMRTIVAVATKDLSAHRDYIKRFCGAA